MGLTMPVILNTSPFLAPFRVQETLSAPGTANLTLGTAAPGYRTFAQGAIDAYGSAVSYYVWYLIEDLSNNYEVGVGLVSSGSMSRTPVYSSNAQALVNFAGPCTVSAIDAPEPITAAVVEGFAGLPVPTAMATPGRLIVDGLGVVYTPLANLAKWGSGVSGTLAGTAYQRVSMPCQLTFDPTYFDANPQGAPTYTPGNGSVQWGYSAQALGVQGFATYQSVIPLNIDYAVAHRSQATARFSGAAVLGGLDVNTSNSSHAQGHDVVLSYSQTSSTSATGTMVQPEISIANNTTSVRSLKVPLNSALIVAGEVLGVNGTDYASFKVFGTFFCGATASTLVQAASPTPVTAESSTSGASAWAVAFALDTTNGVINLNVTSTAAHWVANLRVTEAGV